MNDQEYDNHIARLRAEEAARRHGETRTADEILAAWTAENAAKAIPCSATGTPLSELRRSSGLPPKLPVSGPSQPAKLDPNYQIQSDMRGETIYYIEPSRQTSMMFFWASGYSIDTSWMKEWYYPATRTRGPITPEEKEAIIERVVKYARDVQGVSLEVTR